MSILRILLAIALALVGWLVSAMGSFFNALIVLMMMMVPIRAGLLITRATRKTAETRFWRTPLARDLRPQFWQVLTRWFFWLAAATTVELCVIPVQFTPSEYAQTRLMVWAMAVGLMVTELWPAKKVHLPLNLVFTLGWLFIGVQLVSIYRSPAAKDAVVLSPPFRGDWVVMQGGNSRLINDHYVVPGQRYALDVARVVNGQERNGDRKRVESFPSWSSPLFAPASGRVVTAVSDVADNVAGTHDREHIAGNHIVIDLGGGRFVLLAHLKQHSLLVRAGDSVQVGQPLAQCGNSGNTSMPHLHLQVQSAADLFAPGTQTYPMVFRDVRLLRAGHTIDGVVPRRNDHLLRE